MMRSFLIALMMACGQASAAGASTGASIAAGLAAGAATAAVTYIIAKHQATERQRQIAEERARHAYAGMPAKRKSELKARNTRYIAVDTEKDEHTSPQAKKSVMIWDTQSQEVVGNDVYDLKSPPPVGSTYRRDPSRPSSSRRRTRWRTPRSARRWPRPT